MKMKLRPLIIFSVLLCSGCIAIRDAYDNLDMAGDNLILVGSFELSPPLKDNEQDLGDVIGGNVYKNAVIFALGDKVVTGSPNLSNASEFTKENFGKLFFIKQRRIDKIYFSSLLVYTQFTPYVGQFYLPGPFEIDPPAGCNILYIGKIRFSRDPYNAFTKIEVIDDFDAAKQEAEKKFNTKIDMCRVLLKAVKDR
jgi:hypothetical protein